MCCFTKQEFIHGLKKLNATTIHELNQRLLHTIRLLSSDIDLFKQLYRFTFHFGLDEGARILNLDMAISLWRLVYTIHCPPDNVLERWLNFLAKENIRGIQKDAWQVQFLFCPVALLTIHLFKQFIFPNRILFQNFAESFDLNSYDSDEAW